MNSTKQRRFIPGEVKVWLSGATLAVSLTMILGLLGIILANGIHAFWPRQIQLFEIQTPAETGASRQTQLIAGQINKEQFRVTPDGKEVPETQIFTGSREIFPQPFRFIENSHIASSTSPQDLMLLERSEHGDAIVRPTSLKLADGSNLSANSPQFEARLHEVIAGAHELRKEIQTLEKSRLGEINRKLDKLRKQESKTQSRIAKLTTHSPEVSALRENLADTQAEIAALAKKHEETSALIQTTRAKLNQNVLTAEVIGSGSKEFPDSALFDFHFPNRMSWLDKVGFTVAKFGEFLTDNPREANTDGGIFPAIFGTFVMTVLMSAAVTPFGVITAIYLREYARQGPLVKIVRICVNNLAGVPSIVFGVFGLGFFVYFVGGSIDKAFFADDLPVPTFGTPGLLWASLTMALMTLPVVIVATEEALAGVPRGIREAALACGASKWQMIQRIVLPGALPGVMTGLILAMARGAGEVAPLMLTGVVKLAPDLPIDLEAPFIHGERKFMHLGFHLFDAGFHAPDSEAAKPMVFATALLLILLVLAMNLAAILLRNRLRQKLQTSQF